MWSTVQTGRNQIETKKKDVYQLIKKDKPGAKTTRAFLIVSVIKFACLWKTDVAALLKVSWRSRKCHPKPKNIPPLFKTLSRCKLCHRIRKYDISACEGGRRPNRCGHLNYSVSGTLLTHSGCGSAATPPSLWSAWNLMACGSTLPRPSITLCEHVSRSRVAHSEWASFSLGVWKSTRLQHLLTDSTLDRLRVACRLLMSLSFSICSFFFFC